METSSPAAPISNRFVIPPEKRCTARKANGTQCNAPRVNGEDRCCFHRPRPSKAHPVVNPSLSLHDLTLLDLEGTEGIRTARKAIFAHLIAGSLEPHVAKVALDVAETVHRNATRKVTGESSVTRMTKAVMAQPPPPVDE